MMADWTRAKFKDFVEIVDFRDHMRKDWSRYICGWPQVEFDRGVKHDFLCNELKSSVAGLEVKSDSYCNICTTIFDPARANRWKNSHDATMRLDHLRFESDSAFQKEFWVIESQEEEEDSALDLVDLLDLGDDGQDEETWLYESSKRHMFQENPESAIRWCRRTLENRSPEMEAACHALIHVLDQKLSTYCGSCFYKCGAVLPQTGHAVVGRMNRTSYNTSDSSDHSEFNVFCEPITTSCRLQDFTDVHNLAQMQEASLRQDYVSTSAAASPRNSPTWLPCYFNTNIQKTDADGLTAGNKPASSPLSRQQSCQSPKVTGIHHHLTQFKLLKLAQNKGSSPDSSRSPLRTSLRSLQAVRNSRSLDTNDDHADGQIISPPSGWNDFICNPPPPPIVIRQAR
ncbi:SLAIN motif-containing protein-like [Thalassophryne amazonica]|uniref:SLAIN motif-containing protein-like n=1 Tax=Thalassophryne amazonica TaxID=390379 RepID=UPI0014719CF1|nr:SLAIN motif-containing protein-like [Thalassophryne amazonica]